MEKIQAGKQHKYIHPECFPLYLKDKEFKEQENRELQELLETIKQIHRIDLIPPAFYPFIQEVRNGDVLFGKIEKKYKEGIPYQIIDYTYEFCDEKIAWAKANKQFNNVLSELKYGLAIVKNNVENAKKEMSKVENQTQQKEELTKQTEMMRDINQKIQEKKQPVQEDVESDSVDLTSLFD